MVPWLLDDNEIVMVCMDDGHAQSTAPAGVNMLSLDRLLESVTCTKTGC